ncbi:unnamed protein product [[Candida] boidinii]|uniref:Unnamed protein product n=1 Tax=Candida boidinii TaxID=5477 RepID=A0ACB5TLM3_CANBO|nr:unnamed protein product [[Candida] boidinii]GMF52130.1 unnamed protein product [[Candida] boidinii]
MVRNYYVRGAATHTEWKELINMSANNHEADSVKSETTGQDPEAVKVAAPASAPASSTIKTENDMIPSSSHIGIHPSVISGQAKFASGGASTSIHNITNTNSAPAAPTGSSLTETNPWSSTTTNGPPVGYFYSSSNKGDIPSPAPIQHPPPLQPTSAATGTSYPHYAYNPIKNEVRQQPPVVAKSSFISQMTQPSEPLRPLTGSGITNTSSTASVHKFNPIRMVSLLNDDPPEPPVSTHHSEYAPPRPLGHTSVASLLSTPSTTKNFSVSSIMNPSTSSSSYTPLSSGYTPFGANSSYTNNNPIPQPPKAASIRITSLLNSDDNESSDNNNRSSKSSIPFPRPMQSFAPPAPSPSAPSSASLQQPQYMQPFHPPRRPFADMLNPMPAPSFPPYSQSNSHVPNINNLVNNNLPKVGVTPTQNNPDNKNGDRYNNAGSNPLDALANAAFNNKQ